MRENIENKPILSYNKIYSIMDKLQKISKGEKGERGSNTYKGGLTMAKNLIEEKAKEALSLIGYQDGEVDIINIARNLGFTVGIANLPEWDDGFIIIDDNKTHIQKITGVKTDKIIGVNDKRDLQRKRFTIAHEIGHYMLHYAQDKSNLYAHREDKKGKNKEENDADYFAASVLMPKEQFRAKYDELKNKNLLTDEIITLLQKHFSVPYESAKRRIKEVA